jgi:hypothetical protein
MIQIYYQKGFIVLWKKFYIILSPIISWILFLMLVFVLFGGIRDFSLNPRIVFFCFVLIFFIPVSACLLFGNILRKQKLKKNIWSLFAVIQDISLLFLLTGDGISGFYYLRSFGYVLVGISFVLLYVGLFVFIIYVLYQFIRLFYPQ